jgi:predicted dehydrogenase
MHERHDATWQAVAEADDIDVVSVVVANSLHREVVEGLLAVGQHVLCEKPLSDSLDVAKAMAEAARNARSLARIGFTFRRTPGIAYIRDLIRTGVLGNVLHFSGPYWTDYGFSPSAPMSWRYKGGPGSGALAGNENGLPPGDPWPGPPRSTRGSATWNCSAPSRNPP